MTDGGVRPGPYLLAGPVGPWLEPLSVCRASGRAGGSGGYSVSFEPIPLFRPTTLPDGRPGVQIWPGLERVARGAMAAAGLRVESAVEPPPPLRRVWSGGGFIRFVERHARGLVRPNPEGGVDVPELIAGAAVAFPDARVVIIVPARARGWRRELRRHLPGVGLSTGKDLHLGDERVVVATTGALGMAGLPRADLVFVVGPPLGLWDDPLLKAVPDDPPGPGARGRAGLLERLADVSGRLFGVLPRDYRPTRFEAARLAQAFGTEEFVVPRPGHTERPVRTHFEPLAGGPTPAADVPALELKRAAVWGNPVLNRRAAALARAAAAGDVAALRGRFPGVAVHLPAGRPNRVLVVVENTDHAAAVAGHLRDWPVVSADADPPAGAANMIATAAGVGKVSAGAVDVLVRLDLGVGLPPLPLPGWLATPQTDPPPLLLVDFAARSHPVLRRWTASRVAAYAAAGWPGAGADPDAAALARFRAATAPRRARR